MPGLNPGQVVEATKLEYGLDMPRILLKEKGAFGQADTSGAWLSSACAVAGDKTEEGEDDIKLSCPLCLGRHMCYNRRDKRSLSHEVNSFPGLVQTAHHTMGADHAQSHYLNRKKGDVEGRASYWSEVIRRVPSSEISGEEDQVSLCEQLDALSPFNPLSEMHQKKKKENLWTDLIISTP
ncbi:hypothetical protein FXO38_29968 [Capsicum annuum]|nr:hypothetical protein FXO38_29968 [Capsicum annuum]KAF3639378.1 hypothetical protein FXO37_23987 [Capsicum annuum]